MDLLGSDSSDEDKQVSFKINQNYAKNYEIWRKKEERQKLIDKYGEIDSSDSSSEEGEIRSTPQMDKDWLRTYAVVRFQQPRLYKEGETFFHNQAEPVVKHKEKATTLKDHERKFILEKGGVESDEEAKPPPPQGQSYFEEQEDIKKSFKNALEDSSDEDTPGENSELLVRKQKTAAEQKKDENEYLEWLKGERAELEDKEAAAELAPLKEYWNDPSLSEKERVLRDYVLNNGYMDQEESEEEEEEAEEEIDPNFNAEEEFLEKAEEYEHKYNFRHEEPGSDEIKSYPRVIETSVRTKDTRRAEKRKRKMEKKNMEREQRKEEIRLLRKLQREEKLKKLETLRKVADNPDLDYDLEADFDPDEHNKIMQKFFNEDYEGDTHDVSKKPTFEYDAAVDEDDPDDWWQNRLKGDDEDGAEICDKSNGNVQNSDDGHPDDDAFADDPNFIMDADYDPSKDYKADKRKNKKSNKKLVQKLPVFDPASKTFDEYMDEYLKDRIDKLPFTYRTVVPNDFGLSTEEILAADEKELNAWVSVKKMSTYRSRQEEFADKRKFIARSTNLDKKRQMLPSVFEKPGEPSDGKVLKKKKKRRKKAVANETTSLPLPTSNNLYTTASSSTSEKGLKTEDQTSEIPTPKAKKRKLTDANNVDKKELNLVTYICDKTDQNSANEKKKQKLVKKETKMTDSDLKEIQLEIGRSQKQTDECDVNSEITVGNSVATVVKLKRKKKLKQQVGDSKQDTVSVNVVKKIDKKLKKKKLSISNFNSKIGPSKDAQTMDKKELARQLQKVMSVSRLSKYGIGPNAVKKFGKKKKKKLNVQL